MSAMTVQKEIEQFILLLQQSGRFGWAQVLGMKVAAAMGCLDTLCVIRDDAQDKMRLAGMVQ